RLVELALLVELPGDVEADRHGVGGGGGEHREEYDHPGEAPGDLETAARDPRVGRAPTTIYKVLRKYRTRSCCSVGSASNAVPAAAACSSGRTSTSSSCSARPESADQALAAKAA